MQLLTSNNGMKITVLLDCKNEIQQGFPSLRSSPTFHPGENPVERVKSRAVTQARFSPLATMTPLLIVTVITALLPLHKHVERVTNITDNVAIKAMQ